MWAAGSSGRHALVSKQLCSQGGVTAGHSGITLFGKQEGEGELWGRGGATLSSSQSFALTPPPPHSRPPQLQ